MPLPFITDHNQLHKKKYDSNSTDKAKQISGMVLVVGCLFGLLHFIYARIPSLSPRLIPVIHAIDYVALPASLLTGQDQLPWFEKLPRASAGSLLNMFWIGTCLVLTLAYLSNLRLEVITLRQQKILVYLISSICTFLDEMWITQNKFACLSFCYWSIFVCLQQYI